MYSRLYETRFHSKWRGPAPGAPLLSFALWQSPQRFKQMGRGSRACDRCPALFLPAIVAAAILPAIALAALVMFWSWTLRPIQAQGPCPRGAVDQRQNTVEIAGVIGVRHVARSVLQGIQIERQTGR